MSLLLDADRGLVGQIGISRVRFARRGWATDASSTVMSYSWDRYMQHNWKADSLCVGEKILLEMG